MKIIDVSKSEMGVQVTIELFMKYKAKYEKIRDLVLPEHPEWSRLKACGEQLKKELPSLEGLELVEVRQKLFIGGLGEQQFSFKACEVKEKAP